MWRKPAIICTRLYEELQQREAKIRRLVDANIVGTITYDRAWRIIEANDAFLRIVDYERVDLSSGRLGWMELTPPEWREQDLRVRAPALQAFGSLPPCERELFRKDGSRAPVVIGAASFDADASGGVAFVLDLTDRKRAEDGRQRAEAELQQARTALAHRQRGQHARGGDGVARARNARCTERMRPNGGVSTSTRSS